MNVAGDALAAQSAALDITGQNISNANTPGYVRRVAQLENRALGQGQSGGVLYMGPLRMVDRFANARVFAANSMKGAADARSESLQGLEAALAPSTGGIGDSMSALFSSATDLAQNAKDPTARATFLARAEQVAQSFNDAASGLAQRRQDLLGQAQGAAGEINTRLAKIADMNQKIASAQALGEPATDLRDQRDKLIGEVGERIGVQAVEEPNGMVTLLSSGSSLVSGGSANKVDVALDAQGAMQVTVQTPTGGKSDVTSHVSSGALAGMIEARDKDIPALQQNLDQLAYDFSTAVNAAHTSGVGLDGVGGRPLFSPLAGPSGAAAALAVDASVKGQPDRVAAAASAADLPAGNAIALQMAGLAGQPIGAGGTPAERFGNLGGTLGNLQASAQGDASLRADTAAVAQSMREQSAGVSVEEEMVNMTRYQNAFTAAQRVLKVADDLLDGLIKGL
jgi:flagellar hook-associated protein 1 FlgK